MEHGWCRSPGLSGSGKTEVVIWNLEAALAAQGHQVVSLDAQQLIKRADAAALLREIDDVVRPTVVIFDESLYIRGPRRGVFMEFAERFLGWTDRHLVFVGGGRAVSPGSAHGHRARARCALGAIRERARPGAPQADQPAPGLPVSGPRQARLGRRRTEASAAALHPRAHSPLFHPAGSRCGSTSTPRSRTWIRPGR